jgi:hypothetical protein
MIALLLRLYPARWRTRYGDEFTTLLAERTLGPFDVADVLLGAVDAHLHLRGLGSFSEHRRGFPMSLRIGGLAAFAGGALVLTGWVWAGVDPADSDPGFWFFFAGLIALLVGLTGLSAFQARTHPALVWAAFLLPAVGGAVMTFGLVAMALFPDRPLVGNWAGWNFFFVGLLTTVAGSFLFAVATLRTRALPRSGAAFLAIASALALLSFIGSMGLGEWLQPVFIAGFLAYPIGWMVLGLQAIRLDRPVMATGAGAA